MNELTKNQKCIVIRTGIFIWLDENEANKFQLVLDNITQSTFIKINGRSINSADVSGVYLPEDIQELYDRKNHKWNNNEFEIPDYAKAYETK